MVAHSQAALNVDEGAPEPTLISDSRFGFPKQDGRSLSYWLQSIRCDPLLDCRTTPELPQSTDIVIIGSGLTGTLIAHHCIETWPSKRVLVLEAREFCSGATGRNAGHCKPDSYRGFAKYEKAFGSQQAVKILQNEYQTWFNTVQYIRDNKVDCDLWVGDTLDVPMNPELAAGAKDVFERLKAAGGKVDHIKVTLDPVEAAKITRIKDAQACYAWPAASLHPWKLAAHVMRQNLKDGINLQTHTKVLRVKLSLRNPEGWIIETDRGEVECSQVIHATNAYSSALEPSLRGIIRPSPHMCNKVVPPETFAGSKTLKNTYGVLLPGGAVISINPRCTSDGILLFGGTNAGQQRLNRWIEEHPERGADDSLANVEYVRMTVQSFVESQFPGWNGPSTGPGELYDYSWSGILGLSADGVPFIGELPDLPGQWICAGHNGHGMARIFTAAPGLVQLMAGQSWEDTGLPEVFQITSERLQRLRK